MMSDSTASVVPGAQPSSPAIKLISRLESSSPHMGEGEAPSSLVSKAASKGLPLLSINTAVSSSALKSSSILLLLPRSQATTTCP